VAALVTLSWVMPWYVLWLLPFAAVARPRTLRAAAVVLSLYLALAWIPQSTSILHAAGFTPTRTPIGRIDHAFTERLLH
jgi:hypothetical protein